MPEDVTPTATPETPTTTPDAPTAPAAGQDAASLPQWARDSITRANNEAAETRIKLRDEQAKVTAADAKLAEVENGWQAKLTARERELAATTHRLPETVANRITGGTFEEMLADAESLAKLFVTPAAQTPQPPASLSGGLTPQAQAELDSFDPAKLANEALSGRLVRR